MDGKRQTRPPQGQDSDVRGVEVGDYFLPPALRDLFRTVLSVGQEFGRIFRNSLQVYAGILDRHLEKTGQIDSATIFLLPGNRPVGKVTSFSFFLHS